MRSGKVRKTIASIIMMAGGLLVLGIVGGLEYGSATMGQFWVYAGIGFGIVAIGGIIHG